MRMPTFPWNRPTPAQLIVEASGQHGAAAITEARPFINTGLLDANGLRINMWCQVDGMLGIVTGARIDGMVEVTLQKPDGTTMMTLDARDRAVPAVTVVDPATVRRATIEMIPASRHPDVDHVEHMRKFGYPSESEIA